MQAALSGSYINTAGPLNPDNYLVTPKMYIEKGKKLTYTVAAYDDNDFAEKYDVLLGTVENGRFNTVATISTETLSTREQQNREFSLDQWAGQSLSIAFRHYDCTNMYFIIIDNVKVQ